MRLTLVRPTSVVSTLTPIKNEMDAYSNEFGVLVDRIKGEKVNIV